MGSIELNQKGTKMAFFSLGVAMSDDQSGNESQDNNSQEQSGSNDGDQSSSEDKDLQ